MRQWQTLRTTIASIDYHLLDAESARLSQAISEHLGESFAALDKIKLAKRVHDETLAERLISAVFRWQLPGQAKAPKKDPKRLAYASDFVINLGTGATGQKDKEPVPAVDPHREWIEGAK